MKDEVQVYFEDVKEKSLVARNAHNRARRPARPRINNISEGAWKKMNGPIYTCNLNAPMTYSDFKAMPTTMQQEYIQGLVDAYDIGPNAICQLFGLNNKTGAGSRLFKKLGIKTSAKASRTGTEKFLTEFCSQEKVVTPPRRQTRQWLFRISRSALPGRSIRRVSPSGLRRFSRTAFRPVFVLKSR